MIGRFLLSPELFLQALHLPPDTTLIEITMPEPWLIEVTVEHHSIVTDTVEPTFTRADDGTVAFTSWGPPDGRR